MKERAFLIKQGVLILVPPLLVLSALFFLYCNYSKQSQAITGVRVKNNVRIANRMLSRELAAVVSDLQFMADCHEADEVFHGELAEAEAGSIALFIAKKNYYDQVRYIDITGMEIFKAVYNGGYSRVASAGELRFEGNRYYVAEGLKLIHGELYISPFELQTSGGEVEQPIKPMIRFVTPVCDRNGARRGMVVIDYLGQKLFELFDKVPDRVDDRMMLLNKDGYWLRCENPENEWGFMFDDRRDRTFQTRFPEAWNTIASSMNGQFLGEEGLFTFDTICLKDIIESSKTENREHEAGCWKVVSLVPREVLLAPQRQYAARLGLFGGPAALFLAAAGLFLAHMRNKNRLAEQTIIEQNTSFSRFVPKEFLRLLGKGDLQDVELSSSVQRDVTVLFSDIRSYSTLSESMESREVFQFLNDYFKTVSGPVATNHGFIDIFIGDALMALFPRSSEDALRAAIAMRRDLVDFSREKQKEGAPEVHCGYGLHFGEATLGAIGTYERMQTTAIGDTVNLAARIESVTKAFKLDIVISDSVYGRLPDKKEFLLREIDTVRVKGKHEPVVLYECYNGDPEDLAACKTGNLALWEQGLGYYKVGEFDEALEVFTALAEACPKDSMPPIYIRRCNTLKRIPPGDDWAGISTL